jgi:hypothetical protein
VDIPNEAMMAVLTKFLPKFLAKKRSGAADDQAADGVANGDGLAMPARHALVDPDVDGDEDG